MKKHLQHAKENPAGNRFAFGENWWRFLSELDDDRVRQAKQSLSDMLATDSLQHSRFLDIGSGSGLFSLAARELGATVHSFDSDTQSVACTAELRRRYFPDDPNWTIEQGSVLDSAFLKSLGQWDVVYCWGVLHHTGNMLQAFENVTPLVQSGGQLFIAIYNDQGRKSKCWRRVKVAYNWLPRGLRWIVLWPATIRLWAPTMLRDLFAGRPFHSWRHYSRESVRGMSAWRDVVDWVGGLPFEVAKPEEVFDFFADRGFRLERLRTCGGGHGCNEFVLLKS